MTIIFNDKKQLWGRLSKLLIEIFIIVFSISLSFGIQNWSEYQKKQADVREFLIGIKNDLKNDIKEMQEDKKSYLNQKKAFQFITQSRPQKDSLHRDSLKYYGFSIFNQVGLNPNNGRFEGFKSSGKLGDIENKELQNLILDLYQENIIQLIGNTNGYIKRKIRLDDFIINNRKRITDTTSNLNKILLYDEAQNICQNLVFVDEIINRYDICINKATKIITLIDREYPQNLK
ncbi:MAG: DUF6090 family protein [Microscillaceae bacterium]|nr:DUF6090 family protein [Microscillaceae bacterium]